VRQCYGSSKDLVTGEEFKTEISRIWPRYFRIPLLQDDILCPNYPDYDRPGNVMMRNHIDHAVRLSPPRNDDQILADIKIAIMGPEGNSLFLFEGYTDANGISYCRKADDEEIYREIRVELYRCSIRPFPSDVLCPTDTPNEAMVQIVEGFVVSWGNTLPESRDAILDDIRNAIERQHGHRLLVPIFVDEEGIFCRRANDEEFKNELSRIWPRYFNIPLLQPELDSQTISTWSATDMSTDMPRSAGAVASSSEGSFSLYTFDLRQIDIVCPTESFPSPSHVGNDKMMEDIKGFVVEWGNSGPDRRSDMLRQIRDLVEIDRGGLFLIGGTFDGTSDGKSDGIVEMKYRKAQEGEINYTILLGLSQHFKIPLRPTDILCPPGNYPDYDHRGNVMMKKHIDDVVRLSGPRNDDQILVDIKSAIMGQDGNPFFLFEGYTDNGGKSYCRKADDEEIHREIRVELCNCLFRARPVDILCRTGTPNEAMVRIVREFVVRWGNTRLEDRDAIIVDIRNAIERLSGYHDSRRLVVPIFVDAEGTFCRRATDEEFRNELSRIWPRYFNIPLRPLDIRCPRGNYPDCHHPGNVMMRKQIDHIVGLSGPRNDDQILVDIKSVIMEQDGNPLFLFEGYTDADGISCCRQADNKEIYLEIGAELSRGLVRAMPTDILCPSGPIHEAVLEIIRGFVVKWSNTRPEGRDAILDDIRNAIEGRNGHCFLVPVLQDAEGTFCRRATSEEFKTELSRIWPQYFNIPLRPVDILCPRGNYPDYDPPGNVMMRYHIQLIVGLSGPRSDDQNVDIKSAIMRQDGSPRFLFEGYKDENGISYCRQADDGEIYREIGVELFRGLFRPLPADILCLTGTPNEPMVRIVGGFVVRWGNTRPEERNAILVDIRNAIEGQHGHRLLVPIFVDEEGTFCRRATGEEFKTELSRIWHRFFNIPLRPIDILCPLGNYLDYDYPGNVMMRDHIHHIVGLSRARNDDQILVDIENTIMGQEGNPLFLYEGRTDADGISYCRRADNEEINREIRADLGRGLFHPRPADILCPTDTPNEAMVEIVGEYVVRWGNTRLEDRDALLVAIRDTIEGQHGHRLLVSVFRDAEGTLCRRASGEEFTSEISRIWPRYFQIPLDPSDTLCPRENYVHFNHHGNRRMRGIIFDERFNFADAGSGRRKDIRAHIKVKILLHCRLVFQGWQDGNVRYCRQASPEEVDGEIERELQSYFSLEPNEHDYIFGECDRSMERKRLLSRKSYGPPSGGIPCGPTTRAKTSYRR